MSHVTDRLFNPRVAHRIQTSTPRQPLRPPFLFTFTFTSNRPSPLFLIPFRGFGVARVVNGNMLFHHRRAYFIDIFIYGRLQKFSRGGGKETFIRLPPWISVNSFYSVISISPIHPRENSQTKSQSEFHR